MGSNDSDVDKSRHQHYNKLIGKIKQWKYSYEPIPIKLSKPMNYCK